MQLGLVDFQVQPWRKAILEVFAKFLPNNLASVYTMKQLPTQLGVVHDHDTGKIKAVRHQTAVQAYVRIMYLNEPKHVQPQDDLSHVFCPEYVEFLEQAAAVKQCKQIGFCVYDLIIGNDDIDYRYVKVDLASRSVQITVNDWDYLVRLRPPFNETFKSSFELLGLLRVISKLTLCKERVSIQCRVLYRQDVEILNTKYYKNTLSVCRCCSSCRSMLSERMDYYRKILKVYPKMNRAQNRELIYDKVISAAKLEPASLV